MVEEERSEVLSKLYALRAGCSAISIEKEKYDNLIKKNENYKEKIVEKENEIIKENEYLEENVVNAKRRIKNAEYRLRDVQKPKKRKTKVDIEWKNLIIGILLLLAGLALLGGAGGLGYFCYLAWIDKFTSVIVTILGCFIAPLIALACVVFGPILFVLGIMKLCDRDNIEITVHKKYVPEEDKIKNCENNLQRAKDDLVLAEAEFEKGKVNLENYRNKDIIKKWAKVSENEKSMESVKNNANLIFKVLYNEFSSMLDIRDWENMDLVIYYVETHRADSIKEALQQIDKEKQNNAIVQAINGASEKICNTINSNFKSLQLNMVDCFTNIIKGFAILSKQISDMEIRQNEQMNQLSNVISSIDFNSALQERSSTTSQQLIDDVSYMRTLAEGAEIRRRNNM